VDIPVYVPGAKAVRACTLPSVAGDGWTLISRDQSRADERLLKTGVGITPLCVMTVRALTLLLGNAGGSYGIAVGNVLAVAGAALFSWIALIELRRSPPQVRAHPRSSGSGRSSGEMAASTK
jgi:hypothetical protein